MPTSTNVTNLKINTLTKAQYDTAVQGGVIGPNELSIITDLDESIQVTTMPTASAGELGKIYQFIGATDASYTNGYFYKCVSDGQTPATYSWEQTDVMPAGSSLPSQTGHSGEFLTTDGTDASWAAVNALQNVATGTNSYSIGTASTDNYLISFGDSMTFSYASNSVAIGHSVKSYGNSVTIGYGAQTKTSGVAIGMNSAVSASGSYGIVIGEDAKAQQLAGIAIGRSANAKQSHAIAIGRSATSNAQYAIQLGGWGQTNSDANTLKVGNANGNFEMMSADGTIPEARLADTTNATQGQVLTLDSNNNAVWQTPSTAVTSTTATLVVANWSSNTQTLTVNGVTSSNVVIVSPQPLSSGDYATAGVLCTAQNTNSLTFTCTQTPSNAIDLSIVIIG